MSALIRRVIPLAVLLCVGAGNVVTQDLKLGLENTRIILISQYMIRTGNEALLITDAEKVKELVRLFKNNRTAGHACAYHWIIWFRQGTNSSIPFAHNEECEIYKHYDKEIHSVLNAYFSTIKQNPTHFIFNVKVPASMGPEEVVRRLEEDQQKVFFFAGPDQRLPYVTIQATSVSDIPKARRRWTTAEERNVAAAKAKLSEALSVLRNSYAVIKATEFDRRSSSFGGGKIEDRVQTTIYFPLGTRVDDVIVPTGLQVLARKTPTAYMIQLVVQQRFSAELRQALMSRNPFILDILTFPKFDRDSLQ